MKKTLCIFLCFTAFLCVKAQYNPHTPWMQELAKKKSNYGAKGTQNEYTFKEITDAFDEYWKDKNKNEKANGYKPFMRWREHWKNSLLPDGRIPSGKYFMDIANQISKMPKVVSEIKAKGVISNHWTPLGYTKHKDIGSALGKGGTGRINFIIPDPKNKNIIYVGTPAGGLWKSTNNGSTWKPLTDHFAQLGVSGIAIDPSNTNTIYITTGDDDRSDSRGIGIWKTTDGGATKENWKRLPLLLNVNNLSGNEIYLHPKDSKTLWLATNRGFFRSKDGGYNWGDNYLSNNQKPLLSGNIRDFKLKPDNPNIQYVISNGKFYRFNSQKKKFEHIDKGLDRILNDKGESILENARWVIEVTPANPEYVYLLNSKRKLYLSTNSGKDFKKIAEGTDMLPGDQTTTDLAIAASPTNPDKVFVGSLRVRKSENAKEGKFERIEPAFEISIHEDGSKNELHADIHFLRYYGSRLFVGSDGGIDISYDDGKSFYNKNDGLQINQFYRIATPKIKNTNHIIGGTQDNGGYHFNGTSWRKYHHSDGMDCAILDRDPNVFYGFRQNGDNLFYTENGGKTVASAVKSPYSGEWITPLALNQHTGDLYVGYETIYKLVPVTFNKTQKKLKKISSFNFSGNIDHLEIDPINSVIMYAAYNSKLFRSFDSGVTWNLVHDVRENVKNSLSVITSVEVDNNNSAIVYVTTSSTEGGVYKLDFTNSNKKNVTNISGGELPKEGKNIVRHHKYTNDLYVGTYSGVFYKKEGEPWKVYSGNLPSANITDIEINPIDNEIIVATFGRGIWKAPLVRKTPNMIKNITSPTNLRAISTTHRTSDLAWDPVAGNNIIYDIYNDDTFLGYTKNTYFKVKELFANENYTLKVRTRDKMGNVSDFTEIEVYTLSDIKIPETVFLSGFYKDGAIKLSWYKSKDEIGIYKYNVYVNDKEVGSVDSSLLSFDFKDLKPSTTYKIEVTAIDFGLNESERSNTITVTTPSDVTPPSYLSIKKSNITATTAKISWETCRKENTIQEVCKKNEDIVKFKIYKRNIKEGKTFLKSVDGSTRTTTITGLHPSTSYYIDVEPEDKVGNTYNGKICNCIYLRTKKDEEAPISPALVYTSNITATSLKLGWWQTTDNHKVTGYKIYQNGKFIQLFSRVNATELTIKNLTPNTNYSFAISAIDPSGNESTLQAVSTVKTLHTKGICFDVKEWKYGTQYKIGDRIVYKQSLYEKTDNEWGWKLIQSCDANLVAKQSSSKTVKLPLVDELTIAPNPIKEGILQIYLPSNTSYENASYEIIDSKGIVILKGKYSPIINANMLPQGIFFVKIKLQNNRILTKQFIKE